jgi:hypothetical protein
MVPPNHFDISVVFKVSVFEIRKFFGGVYFYFEILKLNCVHELLITELFLFCQSSQYFDDFYDYRNAAPSVVHRGEDQAQKAW